MGLGHLLFGCVLVAGLARTALGVKNSRPVTAFYAGTVSFIWTFCLVVPGHLQANSTLESKLERANLLSPVSSTTLDSLVGFWALELAVLLAAEFVVSALGRSSSSSLVGPAQQWSNVRQIVAALLLIGLLAYGLFPPPALEDRAEDGQGLGVVLRGFLVAGLALLAYTRCYSKKINYVVLLVGVLFLAALNVRSPLIVVFIAFLVSSLEAGAFRSKGRSIAAVLLCLVVALTGAVMSNFRSNITRDLGYSLSEVISETLADPLVAPFEAGIDTLDGYRMSFYVLPQEGARPEAILPIVTTFVPRSIWPEKPGSLSVELSAKYLDYRASGQFLSPVGFLSILTGGYIAGLLALAATGLLFMLAFRRFANTPWMIFVSVAFFRFMLGGSPFDIYYSLTLALPVLVVKYLVDRRSQGGDIDRALQAGRRGAVPR